MGLEHDAKKVEDSVWIEFKNSEMTVHMDFVPIAKYFDSTEDLMDAIDPWLLKIKDAIEPFRGRYTEEATKYEVRRELNRIIGKMSIANEGIYHLICFRKENFRWQIETSI